MPLLIESKVTSPFGWRVHPITKEPAFHQGVDLMCRKDNVHAFGKGKVVQANFNKILGNFVVIKHSYYESWYQHLDSISVAVGQVVDRKEKIGISGNTGASTGYHLHFGIKCNERWVDPMLFEQVAKIEIDVNKKKYRGLLSYDDGKSYIEARAFTEDLGHTINWTDEGIDVTLNTLNKDKIEEVIQRLKKIKETL